MPLVTYIIRIKLAQKEPNKRKTLILIPCQKDHVMETLFTKLDVPLDTYIMYLKFAQKNQAREKQQSKFQI